MEKKVIRALWRLADRMNATASLIRNANLPGTLTKAKHRKLRHLNELNHIRDMWADSFRPSRRKRVFIPPYQVSVNKWAIKAMYGGGM